MEQKIKQIRESLFDNRIDVFLKDITAVLGEMINNIETLNKDEKKMFNELVVDFDIYIKNGDYLTAADVMKFEIIKLFTRGEN